MATVDKEKEEDDATAAKRIHELEIKIANLQSTSKSNKAILFDAKKAKYEVGYKK